MKVLVTGGAGYIGSTVCSALLDAGHTPVILDNLATGHKGFTKDRIFYDSDIGDTETIRKIFAVHPNIDALIHCAALILVPESVENPYEYYRENVSKSIELFKTAIDCGCIRIIFSSSGSVYDQSAGLAVTEEAPLNPGSTYARTKVMVEQILRDFCAAYGAKGITLRYFNPIGADPKMRSGPYIKNASHVLDKLVNVSRGFEPDFTVTGVDWPTRDGSGLRDYIHIWDLARAHVAAVERFDGAFQAAGGDYLTVNLGSGAGVTVKELVGAFEEVLGHEIPKREAGPRPGDVAGACANADKAYELLGWKAEKSVTDGISDALEWNRLFFED